MNQRALSLLLALLSAGCSTTPAAPTAAEGRADASTRVALDVSALFPASSSRTLGDGRALAPGLLAKVTLERNALVGVDGVDPWLARALFGWLVARGAVVQAADQSGHRDETARLVGVRFAAQRDELSVSVGETAPGEWFVRYWAGRRDLSTCAPAMKLPLTSIQFEGVLLDADGREVAHFAEAVAVAPALQKDTIDLGLDPCAAIVASMDDAFAPTEGDLLRAAENALDSGFSRLVTAPSDAPP